MQCYHHDFHLQPSKNVVMFLIFVYCFYFCHIPVCWLVPMCICFLSFLSICLLSIFYPFLAEGRLSVGGWSMAPLARCRDPGKGTCTAAARLCASLFNCTCFWRSMRKKLLWITHISSMSQAFVSHRVPFHCSGCLHLDKSPGPCSCIQWRWAHDSLRNLCSWQVFHWFCWLPQATLTSQFILLLSESFICIFLPTVEIYINMSFCCLSHINILGYFLRRDFIYLYIKVIVVQVVTWVNHVHGCCFIYIQGYIAASAEGWGAQASSATRTCEIINRARVAHDSPWGNWNPVEIY